MSDVRWLKTTREVYYAIYGQHHKELAVHGTVTDTGNYNGEPHIMTEWGLPGADYPIMKYDRRGEENTYWLAVVKRETES